MMMRFLAVLIVALSPVMSQAKTYGTEEEAFAVMDRAVALCEVSGLDALAAGVSDTSNAVFHDRVLRVIVGENDVVRVAHWAKPGGAGSVLTATKMPTESILCGRTRTERTIMAVFGSTIHEATPAPKESSRKSTASCVWATITTSAQASTSVIVSRSSRSVSNMSKLDFVRQFPSGV